MRKTKTKSSDKMKTQTEISLVTFKQRLAMLPNPPQAPVKGRGFKRECLTSDSDIVDFAINLSNPHVACVSERKAINGFGKLGYPKSVFVSPEFFALFS